MQLVHAVLDPAWLNGVFSLVSGVLGGAIALVGAHAGDKRRARAEQQQDARQMRAERQRDARERAFKLVHEFHAAAVAAQLAAGSAVAEIVLNGVRKHDPGVLDQALKVLDARLLDVTSSWSRLRLTVPEDQRLMKAVESTRFAALSVMASIRIDYGDLTEFGSLSVKGDGSSRSYAHEAANKLELAMVELSRASVEFLGLNEA